MKVRWKLACLLFAITILVSIKYSQSEMSLNSENDVYVSNEDDEDENMHQIHKRDTNSNQDILKTYIKNLKNVRLFFFFMIYMRLRIIIILKLKQ